MIGSVVLLVTMPFSVGCVKPVVATYSIVAQDPATGDLGVAVASRFLAVGSVVPYATAGVGAIATQSYANTTYGKKGLELLSRGVPAPIVLERLLKSDKERERRQVGIVDARGRAAAFTGKNCLPWAGHVVGTGFAVQGNILTGPEVVRRMAEVFQRAKGELAERLIAALEAGEEAGGDARGKQSAAILVVRKGGGYLGLNDRYIDLRVDDDPQPVQELKRILSLKLVQNVLSQAAADRRKKRLDVAVRRIQKALAKFPDSGVLYYDLSCYLALLKRKQESLMALKKAVELDPSLRIMAETDSDLDLLRQDPRFKELVPERQRQQSGPKQDR